MWTQWSKPGFKMVWLCWILLIHKFPDNYLCSQISLDHILINKWSKAGSYFLRRFVELQTENPGSMIYLITNTANLPVLQLALTDRFLSSHANWGIGAVP